MADSVDARMDRHVCRPGMRLIGWEHVVTGAWWGLPEGHGPYAHDCLPWLPVYAERDSGEAS